MKKLDFSWINDIAFLTYSSLTSSPLTIAISIISLTFLILTLVRLVKLNAGQCGYILNAIRLTSALLLTAIILGAIVLIAGIIALAFTPKTNLQQIALHISNNKPIILFSIGFGLTLGIFARWGIARYLEPYFNERAERLTRKSRREHGITDIRHMEDILPTELSYDPTTFFERAAQKDSIFFGLDQFQQPIYLKLSNFMQSSVQIMGPSGYGKGIMAGLVLAQRILTEAAIFCIDPKHDEWAPHVLKWACKVANKSFILIDLRQGTPPQINPLYDIDENNLYELLVSSFGLATKGGDSDHYRKSDRKVARLFSQSIGKSTNLSNLLKTAAEFKDDAEGFYLSLEEIANISSIQTNTGGQLEYVLNNGGCVYFLGATKGDSVITLQKMMLVRLIQLIEKRGHGGRHASIFLDEFRYSISPYSVGALGTIRDKNSNLLLAHQSLGDLRAGGADLDADSVYHTVIDNTPIKWIYRTPTMDSAAWASGMTGTVLADNVSKLATTNEAQSELIEDEKRITQIEKPYIGPNVLMSLPARCALCITDGLPKLAFASPIKVEKTKLTIRKAPKVNIASMAEELLPTKPKDKDDPSDDLLPKE